MQMSYVFCSAKLCTKYNISLINESKVNLARTYDLFSCINIVLPENMLMFHNKKKIYIGDKYAPLNYQLR